MTDYLELLLERRREEDEEQDVLRLDAEGETAVFSPRAKKREAAVSPEGSVENGIIPDMPEGRLYLPEAAADRLRQTAAPEDFDAPAPRSPAGPGTAPRRKTAGTALDRAVEQAKDALGAGRQAAPLPAGEGGGAEGLARRLSQAALAAAAPVRTAFQSVEDGPPAGTDWEEFDRRLERDARRYDGGLGIY